MERNTFAVAGLHAACPRKVLLFFFTACSLKCKKESCRWGAKCCLADSFEVWFRTHTLVYPPVRTADDVHLSRPRTRRLCRGVCGRKKRRGSVKRSGGSNKGSQRPQHNCLGLPGRVLSGGARERVHTPRHKILLSKPKHPDIEEDQRLLNTTKTSKALQPQPPSNPHPQTTVRV